MVIERVYNSAFNKLKDRHIKEVRIGIELLGVELDDGSIGVNYVLKDELKGCAALPEAGRLNGIKAEDAAKWALNEKNVIKRAIAMAIFNAVAPIKNTSNDMNIDAGFAVEISKNDIVGMIGNIRPVVKSIKDKAKEIIIFDRSQIGEKGIYHESEQEERLKNCDIVYITGTTLINDTFESVISYCKNAREIIMVGPSTPLYPEAFMDTKITCLASMKWKSTYNNEILSMISQAAGVRHISKYAIKYSFAL